MMLFFHSGSFDLSSPYAGSGIEQSLAGCTNRQFDLSTRAGWNFDVCPTPGGGIGFGVGYTWKF